MGYFERIRFPDGQVSAKWIAEKDELPWGNYDSLKIRINSYEDLFYVRAIADILARHNIKDTKLFIPCMFGQRSDRRFDAFQSFDLKLITDIINECGFSEVEILDPHSDVTMALIENSVKRSSFEYVEKSVKDVMEKQLLTDGYMTDILLVSPDAGAYKKVFEYGEKLNLPIVAAVKHRDTSGNIDLTFMGDVKDKHCLIVDDLCSRGNTFIMLARALKEHGANKIYLYISHFEGGCNEYKQTIQNLKYLIDGIYTTNSFRDFDEEDNKILTVYKVI